MTAAAVAKAAMPPFARTAPFTARVFPARRAWVVRRAPAPAGKTAAAAAAAAATGAAGATGRKKMMGAGAAAAGENTLSTMKTTARPMNFILESSCLDVSVGTDLAGLQQHVI